MKQHLHTPPSKHVDCLLDLSSANRQIGPKKPGSDIDEYQEVSALAESVLCEILAADLLPLKLSRKTKKLISRLASLPNPSVNFLERIATVSLYAVSAREPARAITKMKGLIANFDERSLSKCRVYSKD